MTVPTVADVWARVMDFDAGEFKAIGPEGAPVVEAFLLNNDDAWLNSIRRPDLEKTVAERAVIVVGEAGSGKTTLMSLLARDNQRQGGFSLFFDFKNVPTLDGMMTDRDGIIRALSQFLRTTVELAVDAAGRKNEYSAAKTRFIFRNKSTPQLEALMDVYPATRTYSDEQLLACKELLDASRAFEADHPEDFIAPTVAQFLPSTGRTLLVFDNVEGLDPNIREILFRRLTSIQQGRSIVAVAIRSENQRQAEVLLQARRDEPYNLSNERSSLMEIARIRNRGARDLCERIMPDLDPAEAKSFHDNFEASLLMIESDEYLLALFTGWLNDNVRNFLTLVADICLALPSLEERSIRGFISSRLLEKRAHSSLQRIFDMQAVYSDKYKNLPFVFLPLRLLVYLQNRDGTVDINDIVDDFERSFGISEKDLRRAIDRFAASESGKPNILRIERNSDQVDQAHLLSCGEIFVKEVVYQCDFLQTLFDRVENPPAISAKVSRSESKLRRSIAVIEELILPSFEKEHPYISPNIRATRRMRTRLFDYERMFSYRHGHWFVGVLKGRLEAYARSRNLLSVAQPTIRRLSDAEARLSFISRGGR